MNFIRTAALLLASALAVHAAAPTSALVHPGPAGKLIYAADKQGNTIPDFSNCGYMGGGVRLPDVPVKATVAANPAGGDDTARIQKSIDEVSQLPPGKDGFRGAVLLKKGEYKIAGSVKISASGVVLRGEGQGEHDTVLIATGTAERALIEIHGAPPKERKSTRQRITDNYVPVGARIFTVADASKFKPGDSVFVVRHGNAAWIHILGMDRIQERPGHPGETKQWSPFDLAFDRVITAIDGNRITIDAPIACAIEQQWGGGDFTHYDDAGRIELAGVENLRGVSEFNHAVTRLWNGKTYFSDEAHAHYLVSFDAVKNAWARDLTAEHFYHGVSNAEGSAKWITVQDCTALDPVSVIDGGRRYPFAIEGQLVLVQRCHSRAGRHAFVVGARVPGPNVFLDCKAGEEYATSEPHHRWSVGGFYDNVSARMAIQDRQWMGTGHGWAGANYVVWNCTGTLVCQQPPTAQNYAIGFVGKKERGAFQRPEGYWESPGVHVEPRSLYLKQLEDRLGPQAVGNVAKGGR
jgi:hypothetical protein